MYGYRYGETRLPKINKIKPDFKVTRRREVDLDRRVPVQVSLGCELVGAAQTHPDPVCRATTEAGCRYRIGRLPPSHDPVLLAKFRAFVRRWIRHNLVPISPDADTSLETWLAGTNYPEWRKEELRAKWEEFTSIDDPLKKYRWLKGFMKDEVYPDWKHARGINSRSDEFKCYMGPIFKLIENEVYKIHHFIKHVPVADRPRVIMEALYSEGAQYMATDYTAFESLFIRELMEACEFELYDYMTQFLPEHDAFMRECHETLGGENVITYHDFVIRILATRMSGEMCTSLGNGFSNLMFMLFLCEEKGCTGVDGFVEGDDGIFTGYGVLPTSADFAALGLNIKVEMHDQLSTASFCGIIFDETDCINVTDPREVLASFGWTTNQYARARSSKLKALLRCKALSYAHQYPGCPIIDALSHYGLRVTSGIDVSGVLEKSHHLTMWDREQQKDALRSARKLARTASPMATRLLVEEKYQLPVSFQLMIESYLDNCIVLAPLDFPFLRDSIPESWIEYFEKYERSCSRFSKDLCYPGQWPVLSDFVQEW